MATTMTLAQLRTAARQEADMVNSQFVSDSEFNTYINQSCFELYDLLIQKFGDDYYIKNPPYTFTTDGTSYLYALLATFISSWVLTWLLTTLPHLGRLFGRLISALAT